MFVEGAEVTFPIRVFEGCQNDNRSYSPRKSTKALLSVSTQAWMMDRKSIPASAEHVKKRLSLMMSETTPRQVLIATEIRVISRKMTEILGSKSKGLVWNQLNDETRAT